MSKTDSNIEERHVSKQSGEVYVSYQMDFFSKISMGGFK